LLTISVQRTDRHVRPEMEIVHNLRYRNYAKHIDTACREKWKDF